MKAKALLSAAALCLGALVASAETITVSTAEEFVNALGSDRTIVIDAPGPLNITPVVEKLIADNKIRKYDFYNGNNNFTGLGYYNMFDGPGLAVVGFKNLTIESATRGDWGGRAEILSSPRQADVLTFNSCAGISLYNLSLGHTNTGECECGVVTLFGCREVTINECDLFGCGTEGLFIKESTDILVQNTVVRDCSYHTMTLAQAHNVYFNNCIFRDNREFSQINVFDSENIMFNECYFTNLKGKLFNVESHTAFFDCTFNNCEYNPSEEVILTNCRVTGTEAVTPEESLAHQPVQGKYQKPREMFVGCWSYVDTNTIPQVSQSITFGEDNNFSVSLTESILVEYYGKYRELERISNNEVIIEYRIDTMFSSEDNFKEKKKDIKGKLRVALGIGANGAYGDHVTVTPLSGLDFGIPKGKARKYHFTPTVD